MRGASCLVLTFLFAGAAHAAPAGEGRAREGVVQEVSSSDLVLVTTDGRHDVIALEPGGALLGVAGIQALAGGDRIRFAESRSIDGLRIVARIELLPPLSVEAGRAVDLGEMVTLFADGARRAEPHPVLIDLRSAGAFGEGHIPGAASAPDGVKLAGVLPADSAAPIILYGESRQDVAPTRVLRRLLAEGHAAAKLFVGGMREWDEANRPGAVDASALARWLTRRFTEVLDLRSAALVAGGTLPRALAVDPARMDWRDYAFRPKVPTFVLVGRDANDHAPFEVAEALRNWQGSGAGFPPGSIRILSGGFDAWRAAGGPPAKPVAAPAELPCVPERGEICAAEFLALWKDAGAASGPLLLDVRGDAGTFRPERARHLPIAELPRRLGELPRDREIVVFCARGRNSRVAQALLERAGLRARFLAQPAPGGAEARIDVR